VKLAPGESSTVPIHAREFWNATGIELESGNRYRLEAAGQWTDLSIATDADGFKSDVVGGISRLSLRLFERWRRMPRENWFKLIGAVDRDQQRAFAIGKRNELTAAFDGEVTCFANDHAWFYWNNKNSIQLTVTRIE
jgi:hypothetical protein